MNERRKIFWRDALMSGTKVGLISVALTLLVGALGGSASQVISFIEQVVFYVLIFYFTRRHSWRYSPQEGFSFGRGFGFVLSMLLFVGAIQGIYSAVMANFFIGPELMASLDQTVLELQQQNLYTPEMIDAAYQTMKTITFNPFAATLLSIVSVEITGLLIGLLVGIFTRRPADMFANTDQGGL